METYLESNCTIVGKYLEHAWKNGTYLDNQLENTWHITGNIGFLGTQALLCANDFPMIFKSISSSFPIMFQLFPNCVSNTFQLFSNNFPINQTFFNYFQTVFQLVSNPNILHLCSNCCSNYCPSLFQSFFIFFPIRCQTFWELYSKYGSHVFPILFPKGSFVSTGIIIQRPYYHTRAPLQCTSLVTIQ